MADYRDQATDSFVTLRIRMVLHATKKALLVLLNDGSGEEDVNLPQLWVPKKCLARQNGEGAAFWEDGQEDFGLAVASWWVEQQREKGKLKGKH